MWKDPIVAEVRENRKKLEESFGNSFHRIYDRAIEIQKQFQGEVISAKATKLDLPSKEERSAE